MSHHYDGIDGTNANENRRQPSAIPENVGALPFTSIDSIQAYQELALRTLASDVKADHFKVCMNALSGMMSETGEVAEIIKKHFFHGHPMDEATVIHLKKEMGDQMWYWAVMCFAFEFDPAEVLAINIEKLRARYPEGFSTERSMNRRAGDI